MDLNEIKKHRRNMGLPEHEVLSVGVEKSFERHNPVDSMIEEVFSVSQEAVRLVTDACYLLNFQADQAMPEQELVAWRERWLREAGALLQRIQDEAGESGL